MPTLSTGSTVASRSPSHATRTVFALLLLGGTTLAACSTAPSDDVGANASSGGIGSSSSDSCFEIADDASARTDGEVTDAGPPTFGIFFTQDRYWANFAAAQPQAHRKAYADSLCHQSALEAGLVGRYQAVIAVDSTSPTLDLPGAGRWCAIQNGVPTCSDEQIIFDGSIARGPQHALTTDQHGNATNPASTFFSGTGGLGEDDGSTIASCDAWSSTESSAGRAGAGAIVNRDWGRFGNWLSWARESCWTARLPLLCMAMAPCGSGH